ncbi:MAG: NUDIX domain-containing protein [Treponema sp.]|nr:NUDIX domain-containing protein [Treponema sp.]
MTTIEGKPNVFGGLVIESAALNYDYGDFGPILAENIPLWKDQGIKVVWLELRRDQARLISCCTEAGFVFHHAREDIIQMTLTLVPGSTIPPYATHYVGAGGVVIDKAGQLLVVSERYRAAGGRRLKLPGGALQEGEGLAEAVIREVKEETGIDTRFEYVACLRHWQGYRYGKSDIYFVCRLSPLSAEIHMDPNELAECLWMPLDEFLSDPEVHEFNKSIVRTASGPLRGLESRPLAEYPHEMLFLPEGT